MDVKPSKTHPSAAYKKYTSTSKVEITSKSKGLGKDFPNGPKKQASVAILIFNKIGFQLKLIKRVGEGHFIVIKGKN